ncbi:MAG: hypothetical protein JST93_33180 [Acidobacteria bacterium]|nr:hypothetical protein [Acidobacteriota bacterium]
MSSNPSLIIVLAEDQQQQAFVRRFLYRLGYKPHDIRFEPLPHSSGGAGEKWVRDHYADAVKAYRYRSSRAATGLVVVIDADKEDVDLRQQQLRDEITRASMEARRTDEVVAHFVPKRNVETWIVCLSGSKANEEDDYKKEVQSAGRFTAKPAEVFYEWSRPGTPVPPHCVPSLKSAIPEAQRLPRKP